MKKNKLKISKSSVVIGTILSLFIVLTFANAQGETLADKIVQVAGERLAVMLHQDATGELSVDELALPEELELGASGIFSTKWIDQNGLVTYVESGSFPDATTTLVRILNPFFVPTSTLPLSVYRPNAIHSATATVDLVMLNITGPATSSYMIYCGGDNDGYIASGAPTYSMINTSDQNNIATGSTRVLENNFSASATYGEGTIITGSVSKIMLTGNYPYFVCYATSTHNSWWKSTDGSVSQSAIGIDAVSKGITGANNTFDGTYKVRIYRSQY